MLRISSYIITAILIANTLVAQNIDVPFRMNIASKQDYVRANGDKFVADPPDKVNPYQSVGGGKLDSNGNPAGGGYDGDADIFTDYKKETVHPDKELYNSDRWAGGSVTEIGYAFPIKNGSYDVITHHNEGYFGVGNLNSRYEKPQGLCIRYFSVSAEGKTVIDKYDYHEMTAAPMVGAKIILKNIKVTDGELNINLKSLPEALNNPSICGIEILPGGSVKEENPKPLVLEPETKVVEICEGYTPVNGTFDIPELYVGVVKGYELEVDKGNGWEVLQKDDNHAYVDNIVRISNTPSVFDGYLYRAKVNYLCSSKYSHIIQLKVNKAGTGDCPSVN